MRASDKAKIRQRRIAHIVLVVFSFSLMFLGTLDFSALRSARMGFSDFVAPLVDLVSVPVRGVETMAQGIRTVASLRAENVRLQAENAMLKRWRRRAEILEGENRQLRSVAGAVAPERRRPLTARAVTAPGGAFAHTVLVANGTDQGIEMGNPVVTADGLVGLVVDVGATHARVLMISDINAQIPVILSSSSWPGVTVGNNGPNLSLRFLPEEAAPKIGELVLTSGHGGVLPAGVPVGRIDMVQDDFVRVQPAVDLRNLSYVSILVGGTDGIDMGNLELDKYYTPLPEADDKKLFEGVNASGEIQ
ncbi:MAG TPA: rod shape-determining protein MreC [Alphaproteobacteria bacterium]|nr:MAG: rod shape-determining protein MreC [SAR116 cluster bacterium MED-G06]HCV88785.1 rod shape-determining protein MreC [Alphaproteobacteria bacterium]|tara:strand:+ start:241 stop:1155 length:915 start_codon:yes stop_codon:yes gene_type:complete